MTKDKKIKNLKILIKQHKFQRDIYIKSNVNGELDLAIEEEQEYIDKYNKMIKEIK